MNVFWVVLLVYCTLCGFTAALLAHTPFKYNGLLLNFIFAPAYWYAAIRGVL